MQVLNTAISVDDISLRTKLLPRDLRYIAHLQGRWYAEECGYDLTFESYVLAGLLEFAHRYDSSKDRVWICEHERKTVGSLIGLHGEEEEGLVQSRYFILLPEYRGIG